MYSDVWWDGYNFNDFCDANKTKLNNPYTSNMVEWFDWNDGYDMADRDRYEMESYNKKYSSEIEE